MDVWRAILPLLGIMYHVNSILLLKEQEPGLSFASTLIHSFRMEAFFAVAGLLASAKLGRPAYLIERFRALLIPFAAIWVLIALWRPSRVSGLLGNETGHLWFLLCLVQLSVLGVVGERLHVWGRLTRVIGGDWRRAAGILLAAACVLTVGFEIAVGIGRISSPAALTPLQSIYYLPYFGGGVVLGRSPALLRSLGHPVTWAVALPFLFFSAALVLYPPDLLEIGRRPAFGTVLAGVAALSCAAAVTGSSLRLHAGPVWRWLGDASYSVYLLHYPLVTIVYWRTEGWPIWPRWALMIALVTAGSLAGHIIIKRSALLRSLFNGASWAWLKPALDRCVRPRSA